MIAIRKAILEDVDGIYGVCTEGFKVTYGDLKDKDYIEGNIKKFHQ